jgi:DMSO reductase anchor subunit
MAVAFLMPAPVEEALASIGLHWHDVALAVLVATPVLSAATLYCTAMIYASLKTIPAWSHRAVVPVYFGFALLTGGLMLQALLAMLPPLGDSPVVIVALLMLAVALVVLKRRYWHDIDRGGLPATRASALGLPADRAATVFERPHTEASYLTKEMGFVVARKHATKLRKLALVLFGAVPVLACILVLLWPPLAAPALAFAALAALLGTLVERWLFFAEAKHVVTLYY